MLLFVVMVSCVSGALMWMLLRLCTSLHSLEGFVLNVMYTRSCFHLVCCSCMMSSDISLFCVCTLLTISCEASWRLRWFLVRILSMFLLNQWLKCLIAPVRICSLLCLVIMSARCLEAVLKSLKVSKLKFVSSVSMLFVKAPQSALL